MLGRLMVAVLVMFWGALGAWGQGLAAGRAAHLKRGVNLSMWYAQANDYSAGRLAAFTTAEDFKLIRGLGFDHVRLSVNPEPLVEERTSGALRGDAMARLDKTVGEIVAAGLVVVVDVHPEGDYKHELRQGEDGVHRFAELWRQMARHFAKTDPEKVYFELMNEPEVEDQYRWAGVQAALVAVVRSEAPQHTVIATGGAWGGVEQLLELEPVADANVIYSFHFYEPMWFTHQSANWSTPALVFLHGVPYPAAPETVAKMLDQEPDAVARYHLKMYGQEHWGRERVAAVMETAAEWGRKHHAPVWVGEFGVYRNSAEPRARARWIEDVRSEAEKHGMGWCMWDYQGGFGVVTKDGGKTTVDDGVVHALGLK